MKRLLFILALFLAFSASADAQVLEFIADALGTPRPVGYNWQLPTQDGAGYGFCPLSTYTITVGSSTAVSIGIVPVGVRDLYATAFNGDIIVGDANISSGTIYNGILIASGTVRKISGMLATTTPNIYFLNNSGLTGQVNLHAWGNR